MSYINTAFEIGSKVQQNLGLLSYIIEFIQANSKPILQVLVLPGLAFTLVFAIIAVWFERKFLARAMLRVGPYYCGGRSGVLQVFADFLKLFRKDTSIVLMKKGSIILAILFRQAIKWGP